MTHVDEEGVGGLARGLRREARANPELVGGLLLDCAVQLGHKAPVYALLLGTSPGAAGEGGAVAAVEGSSKRLCRRSQAAHLPALPSRSLTAPLTCAPAACRLPGLVNVDEPELAAQIAARCAAQLNACLQPGGDVRRARLLLRFTAALAVTNVLHAASVLAAARSLVDAALAAAEAGEPRSLGVRAGVRRATAAAARLVPHALP